MAISTTTTTTTTYISAAIFIDTAISLCFCTYVAVHQYATQVRHPTLHLCRDLLLGLGLLRVAVLLVAGAHPLRQSSEA
jgi:hypothetical protein